MSAVAKAHERPRPTPASPRPGRKVRRAQRRRDGIFKAKAKHQRLIRRFGVKGAGAYEPGQPVVNEHKDRSLAGKARRRALREDREIVAGFMCSCGARAHLTRAGDRDAATREWFDGLYDAHAACDGE